ncbi:MAG: hypothetical protein Q7S11_02530 [bacterium]|nr:hypothetical protein [bacterium]
MSLKDKNAQVLLFKKGINARIKKLVSERPRDLKRLVDWGVTIRARLSEINKYRKVLSGEDCGENHVNSLVDYIQDGIQYQCKACNIPSSVSLKCSFYIAKSFSLFLIKGKNYLAIGDFIASDLEQGSTELMRKNANVCFFMHAVFKGGESFPNVKSDIYEEVGKSWYKLLAKEKNDSVDGLMDIYFGKLSIAVRKFIDNVEPK